jgi:hypothetical protein
LRHLCFDGSYKNQSALYRCKDEARLIAANIASLSKLLRELTNLSEV